MRYFMSDPHFGHHNILKFSRTEFTDLNYHNEHLINQINKTVGQNDTLYILGDIAFSSQYQYLQRIVCNNIRIVLGNHDYPSKLKTMQELLPNARFGGVLELKLNEHKCVLTHVPVHTSQLEFRWKYNIHGHLHQYYIKDPRYINVSMEQLDDYKPISEQEIIKKFLTK